MGEQRAVLSDCRYSSVRDLIAVPENQESGSKSASDRFKRHEGGRNGDIPQVEVGEQRAVLSDRRYPSVRDLIAEPRKSIKENCFRFRVMHARGAERIRTYHKLRWASRGHCTAIADIPVFVTRVHNLNIDRVDDRARVIVS